MGKYTRKALAKELGIGIETLRYYESLGLIPVPVRDNNGYRVYTEEDIPRINHVLSAKKYGFSLKEIKTIFDLAEKTEFKREDLRPFIINKIQGIENQIQELNDLKNLLLQLI